MKVSKRGAHLIVQDMRFFHSGDADESNHIRCQAATTDMITSIAWDGTRNEKNKRLTGATVLPAAICSVSLELREWGWKDTK
jgi:hypothetical protein